MQKRGIAFSVLFLFGIFISLNLVSASTPANFTCSIVPKANCNSTVYGTPLLNLSAITNAHGELITSTAAGSNSYPYSVCCYGVSSSITSPYSCSSGAIPLNKIVGLSGITNAHAEVASETNYANNVCYSSLTNCVNISSSQSCSSVSSTNAYISVVNISAPTNAHLGNGGTQVCCQIPVPHNVLTCNLLSATWSLQQQASGNSVSLNVTGSSGCYSGGTPATISFSLYNSSGQAISSNPPADAIFSSDGNASSTWNINLVNNIPSSGENLVFEASTSGGANTLWSNESGPIKTLTVYPQNVDCIKVNANPAASDYSTSSYYHNTPTTLEMEQACNSTKANPDVCGVGPYLFSQYHPSANSADWNYGLTWVGGICKYWEGPVTSSTAPKCPSLSTLCYDSGSTQPYYCRSVGLNNATCPPGQNPPVLGGGSICTDSTSGKSSGCVNNLACTQYSQDGCISGTSCDSTLQGGLCYNWSSKTMFEGETERAAGVSSTSLTLASDGSYAFFTLVPNSNYTSGIATTTLANGGTVNVTFSPATSTSAAQATATLDNGGTTTVLGAGTEIDTPDGVVVTIGSGGVTAYFPIGTESLDSNGNVVSTSTTMLVKTISASTIQTPNKIPQVSGVNPTWVEQGKPYGAQITANDPDGDPLSYNIISVNGPSNFNLQVNSSGYITSVGNAPTVTSSGGADQYNVKVNVSDGNGGDVIYSYNLLVTPINTDYPYLTSFNFPQVIQENHDYVGQIVAQDSRGAPITYYISQSPSSPSWLSINSSTGLITGTAPSVTTGNNYDIYLVNLTYSNGVNNASLDNQRINVTTSSSPPSPNYNYTPYIRNISSTQVQEGYSYVGKVNAIDPNGDNILYYISNAPSWLSISSSGVVTNTSAIPSVTSSQGFDTYPFTVTVGDGNSNSSSTYQLYVTAWSNPQNPIVIESQPSGNTILKNSQYSSQITALGGSGPLTYSLYINDTNNPPWLGIDSSTGKITGTAPDVNTNTAYLVQLNVSDGTPSDTVSVSYILDVVTSLGGGKITITVNPTDTGLPTAGEGQLLCISSQTGALYAYSGDSCTGIGDINAPGSCASLNPTSSTCSAGLTCTSTGTGAGYCHDNTITAGRCIYNTVSTSGSCSSSSGLIEYNWTVDWTGAAADQPSWCKAGSQVFTCPAQIKLPLFNVYNAIEVIVILTVIYFVVVLAKKKSHKNKVKHSGKVKKLRKK